MATLRDSFENGLAGYDTVSGVSGGGAIAISTDSPRTGAHSLKCTTPAGTVASASSRAMVQKPISGNPSKLNFQAYITLVSGLPITNPPTQTAGHRYLQVFGNVSASSPIVSFGITNSASPRFTLTVYDTPTNTVKVWEGDVVGLGGHLIEVEATAGIAGMGRLWVDGRLTATVTADTSGRGTTITAVRVGLASYAINPAAVALVDDFVISDAYIGAPPETYIAEIVAGAGGSYDTTSPYLGVGVYQLGITPREYIRVKAVPNTGYTFAGWRYWVNGVETSQTFTNPIEALSSSTPGQTLTLQPIFQQLTVNHTVTYQSTPLSVPANVSGYAVPSGGNVSVTDGAGINLTVPDEVRA